LEAKATSKFSKEIVGLTGIARNYGGKDSRKTESLGFCLGFRWGKKIGFFLANETLNASKCFFRHEPRYKTTFPILRKFHISYPFYHCRALQCRNSGATWIYSQLAGNGISLIRTGVWKPRTRPKPISLTIKNNILKLLFLIMANSKNIILF